MVSLANIVLSRLVWLTFLRSDKRLAFTSLTLLLFSKKHVIFQPRDSATISKHLVEMRALGTWLLPEIALLTFGPEFCSLLQRCFPHFYPSEATGVFEAAR